MNRDPVAGDESSAGEDIARVAAHWGDAEVTRRLAEIHWMASPVVCAHLNRQVSGDPRIDWLTWSWDRFVLPLARRRAGGTVSVLVLGCGDGWLERALARRDEVASIDACDVAAGAVASARRRAESENLGGIIRYHVVDLDRDPLPGGPWDVVVAHSVLHHVAALERCYEEIAARLRPDGLLLVNEYTGPRRFQFGERQMEVIQGVLRRLPERLRISATTGGPYVRKEVPNAGELIATDPSEAVRSDRVVPLLRQRFEVLADAGCGGSVLHLLLYDLVHNFDPADRRESRILALLCLLEETLIAHGELADDYRVLVARLPAGAARRRLAAEPGGGHRPRALPGEVIAAGGDAGEGPAGGADPPARLRIHSRPTRDRRHGLELEPVRAALHTRATGWAGSDWTTHALASFPPAGGGGPTLVVDRPGGWLAERLAGEPAVGEVDLLVPVTADGGRLRFELRGVEGAEELAAGRYARVLTNGWLGRAPDRAGLLARLTPALRPGGVLIGDEHTGPEDGRATVAVLRLARELLALLQPPGAPPPGRAERLRDRLVELEHGWLRERFGPPRRSLEELLAPSWRLLEHRPQLGALLQRVLAVAGSQLDPEDDRDRAFLRLACYFEELLTEAGAIDAEYACFAAVRI